MANKLELVKNLSEKINERVSDFTEQDLEAVGLTDRVSKLLFVLSPDFRQHTLTVAEIMDQYPEISSLPEEEQESYLAKLMPENPGYDMEKLVRDYQSVQEGVDNGLGNLSLAILMGYSDWIYTGIGEDK